MNPYEKTAKEMKRQSEGPQRFAKSALGVASAAGAATFAPVLARAAPFLSEYIPQDLAMKGLSKVHPKLGSFVKQAMDSGYDFSEAKDFLGDQIKQSQEPAKQDKNIIEQESPELHSFIDQAIRAGRKPIEAAAIAQNDKRFGSIIQKLMKAHKTPWSSIIESSYGNGEMAQPTQQQAPGASPEQAPNFSGQQQQGQQGQPGPGQQALMSILQKINQRLGQ